MANFKKRKKLLGKIIDKWTYRLGLRWWHITFVLTADPKAIKDIFRDKDVKKSDTIMGRTYADWRYKTATVYINVPATKGKTKRFLEKFIVHELAHIIVNEMREGKIRDEESVVTAITDAIFWTVDDIGESNA